MLVPGADVGLAAGKRAERDLRHRRIAVERGVHDGITGTGPLADGGVLAAGTSAGWRGPTG